MDILEAGSRPSNKGPSDWFTGTVRIDSLFNPFDAARVQGGAVTFEPGDRTAWHTHPLGQTPSSQQVSGACAVGAARSKRSARETRRDPAARSTGTAPRRPPHDPHRR